MNNGGEFPALVMPQPRDGSAMFFELPIDLRRPTTLRSRQLRGVVHLVIHLRRRLDAKTWSPLLMDVVTITLVETQRQGVGCLAL